MKYLIVGLGNIGAEYAHTRHNIGFDVVSRLAADNDVEMKVERYGEVGTMKYKGRTLILLKPSTYMNLSGEAVRYWMQKEKITLDKVLVVVDDLSLPFGTLRMKGKGSDGGHNGLKNINAMVGSQAYARLRFGLGNEFRQGGQIDFVLGHWTDEEKERLTDRIAVCGEIIKSFATIGLQLTMTNFNNK
jgi:PTH1 family peptidyl-tRNA hydrolase